MILSPRSAAYERLENGHGPSRGASGVRRLFGWKKFAIGAVVLIGLVWVFGPRKEDIVLDIDMPCKCLQRIPCCAGRESL